MKAPLVDRLQEVRCDREPYSPEHAKCICRLTSEAADEIERLTKMVRHVSEAKAVRGWKQAVGIIEAQQKALDWCTAQFSEMNLPQGDATAREYWETVLRAQNTGREYLAAMKTAGIA